MGMVNKGYKNIMCENTKKNGLTERKGDGLFLASELKISV